jgi:hypothetical protein
MVYDDCAIANFIAEGDDDFVKKRVESSHLDIVFESFCWSKGDLENSK